LERNQGGFVPRLRPRFSGNPGGPSALVEKAGTRRHLRLCKRPWGLFLGLFDRLKSAFGPQPGEPRSPPRLAAASEGGLAASLQRLPQQERAWITMQEARQLFSAADDQYAFGELDEEGKTRLSDFAARNGSGFDIMPIEGRIYFTRRP